MTLKVGPSSKRPSAAYSSRINVGVNTSKRAAPSRMMWDGVAWPAPAEAELATATAEAAASTAKTFSVFIRIFLPLDERVPPRAGSQTSGQARGAAGASVSGERPPQQRYLVRVPK